MNGLRASSNGISHTLRRSRHDQARIVSVLDLLRVRKRNPLGKSETGRDRSPKQQLCCSIISVAYPVISLRENP
jgi:hypothetical protein